jgi:Zn-dependent alcohol dehydrogenase
MKIKKAKAAILAKSREPLIVDEIELPEALNVGQVLVKILYTTICGAQLNEIAAAKGPDKFLPHLLGHEASGTVVDIGPGITNVKPGDTVVLHWRPSLGIQCILRPTNGAATNSMQAG